jgi:pimeloyl-ACP methyl ester carboxylesterase
VRERFVATNGIRMFAVEAGRGPLVLLLHGWPEFWWSWRDQIPALAAAGYRVVAVDLPGFGRSDKPDVAYDEEWLNRCIAGLVPGLGARRAVLIGHDWGGALAWPFARRYPDLLAGVAGVNTPDLERLPLSPIEVMRMLPPDTPNYMVYMQDRGPAEWFFTADVRGWLEFSFLGPATYRKAAFTPEVIDRYASQFQTIGSIGPTLEYYRNLHRNWELAASLPSQIDLPALLVVAQNDPILPPTLSIGMEARVPNLRRARIRQCGHWTQQEQPQRLNTALIDWLATLPRWS